MIPWFGRRANSCVLFILLLSLFSNCFCVSSAETEHGAVQSTVGQNFERKLPQESQKQQIENWTRPLGWVTIPVYFVTDRAKLSEQPEPSFWRGIFRRITDPKAADRPEFGFEYVSDPNSLNYGVYNVRLPFPVHAKDVEKSCSSYGWILDLNTKDEKLVGKTLIPTDKFGKINVDDLALLPAVKEHGESSAPVCSCTANTFFSDVIEPMHQWQKAIGSSNRNQIMIYVHGFSTPFDNSIREAAEFASWYKMPVIAYSWATPAKPEYWKASITWEQSLARLRKFVSAMEAIYGSENVVLVAHSMGNKLVDHILQERAAKMDNKCAGVQPLNEIDMVFADVDACAFTQHFEQIRKNARLTRVFISGDQDDVLGMSRGAHLFYPRLGAPKDMLKSMTAVLEAHARKRILVNCSGKVGTGNAGNSADSDSILEVIDVSRLPRGTDESDLGRHGHSIPVWLLANLHIYNIPGQKTDYTISPETESPRYVEMVRRAK